MRATHIKPDATVDLRLLGVANLAGTVTGPAGPSALFSVDLDGPTRARRTFSEGSFSFGRLDPGAYRVLVQSEDSNGQAKVDVKPGSPATVAITLAANATVIGTLVDAAGKPLAGLPVALMPDHGENRPQIVIEGPPRTTGPDGRFRIDDRAEPCALIVMLPDRLFSKRGLVLEAGKTLDLGVVTVTTPDGGSGSPSP